MLGNNLRSPREVINMYKQYNIGRMRLYDQNYGAFQALRGTNIELMLGVPNEELQSIASSQDYANTWIQTMCKTMEMSNFFLREFQPIVSSLDNNQNLLYFSFSSSG